MTITYPAYSVNVRLTIRKPTSIKCITNGFTKTNQRSCIGDLQSSVAIRVRLRGRNLSNSW